MFNVHVDLSVHKILGHWLLLPTRLGNGSKDYKLSLLDSLAHSSNLWKLLFFSFHVILRFALPGV